MALPKFYKVCQDQQGNIVPQVLGSVFNHGTAVLASLYQDDAGTLPLANPMTSDAQYGSFKFYVNPGHYDLTFTKPGYTFEPIDDMQVPQDVLTLGTMATQNASAVAITGGAATLNTLALSSPGNLHVLGATGLGTAPVGGIMLAVGGNETVSGTLTVSGATGLGNATLSGNLTVNGATGLGTAPVGGWFLTAANAQKPGGGPFADSTSMARYKQDRVPLTDALAIVRQLCGYRYTNTHPTHAGMGQEMGFVAEEVQGVLPQWVVPGLPGERTIAEQGSTALLVEAVKALLARVEALEAARA